MNNLHRANLAILARFLEQLPETYEHFDMNTYTSSSEDGADEFPSLFTNYNACGTVACAAGHGPAAGIKPLPDETWWDYVDRNFGMETLNESYVDKTFIWLFSEEWTDIDNTPHGAARRIRYFLKNGLPDNFSPWNMSQEDYSEILK